MRNSDTFAALSTQRLSQLFIENLDDLVSRRDALEDSLVQAGLSGFGDDVPDDAIVDIRAESMSP
jgi:hypothetical protein